MPRHYLVIDGYNLMHAGGMARRTYAPGQLERARGRLLRFLGDHLAAAERERTTIVFDAADAPPDLPHRLQFHEMTICFAPPGQEADDTIEEIVAAHSAPRQIRLISSDHRLQRSVRRRRGTFVDSDKFVEMLERRLLRSQSKTNDRCAPGSVLSDDVAPSEKERASGIDTETWARIFGPILGTSDLETADHARDNRIGPEELKALRDEVAREDIEALSRRAQRRSRKKR
jgi:hypothetical protein